MNNIYSSCFIYYPPKALCIIQVEAHTQVYHSIFYQDCHQLKSIRVITDRGKAVSDGNRGRLEELDSQSVSDVNHLEKQLICELKGTQLEAKTVCKIAVKSIIISHPRTCPKYSA